MKHPHSIKHMCNDVHCDDVLYDDVPYDNVPYNEVAYNDVPYDDVHYDDVHRNDVHCDNSGPNSAQTDFRGPKMPHNISVSSTEKV